MSQRLPGARPRGPSVSFKISPLLDDQAGGAGAAARARSTSISSGTSLHEYIDKSLRSDHTGDGVTATATNSNSATATDSAIKRRRSTRPFFISRAIYARNARRYFRASVAVSRYSRTISNLYESIYDELRFPILPEKADSLNHLSGLLWIVTFSLRELADDIVETTEITKLAEAYAKCVCEAMETEKVLHGFREPLSTLSEGIGLFDSMRLTIFGRQEEPPEEESSAGLVLTGPELMAKAQAKNPKTIKETLLSGGGSAKDGLTRLEIYTRTTAKRKWYLFSASERTKKLKLVMEAVGSVTEALVKLRRLLRPVLRVLKNGVGACCRRTLMKHLRSMRSSLAKMAALEDVTLIGRDEAKIIKEMRRAEGSLASLTVNGTGIVRQVLEVLAMSQLCYVYIVDGLGIPMRPCEEVMKTVCKGRHVVARGSGGRVNEFHFEDFFSTRYPDVLRKVPVIIQRTELSLHKCTEKSLVAILDSRAAAAGKVKEHKSETSSVSAPAPASASAPG